jgi:hypothetical protein
MGVQWAGTARHDRAQLLVDHHHARARDDLLAHATARWANFTTSLLVVIATPFIAGSQFFVMFDHVAHTHFFDYTAGGYPSVPAHLLVLLPPGGLHHDAAGSASPRR